MSTTNAAIAGDWIPPGRGGVWPVNYDYNVVGKAKTARDLGWYYVDWLGGPSRNVELTSPEKVTTVTSTFKERERKLSLDDEV
jgi:hypothetical protein